MDRAEAMARMLLADHDVYRAATRFWVEKLDVVTKGRLPGPSKFDGETRKLFLALVAWCETKGVEPRLWLFSLFDVRRWMFPVPKKPGALMSEKHLARWGRIRADGFFRKRVMVTTANGRVELDANRDIIWTAETRKSELLRNGRSAECKSRSLMETLGYHPRSEVCRRCPMRLECAVDLQAAMPFPIIALRNGDITSAQATIIAHHMTTEEG